MHKNYTDDGENTIHR